MFYIWGMDNTLPELKKEIHKILIGLGADPWILGIIGSWYDEGHTDEETLGALKAFSSDQIQILEKSDDYDAMLKSQQQKRVN